MEVDEEVLRHNRKLAIILGSASGAILIAIVYVFVSFWPDYVDWGIVCGIILQFPIMKSIAKRYKRLI